MAHLLLRLKRRRDFQRVARERRQWTAPGLILQVRRRGVDETIVGEASAVRVGLTVSRAVGGAVVRNRVRRRLRAAATEVLAVHAGDGLDVVVVGRKASFDRPFAELIGDLEAALRKLRAWVPAASAAEPRPSRPE